MEKIKTITIVVLSVVIVLLFSLNSLLGNYFEGKDRMNREQIIQETANWCYDEGYTKVMANGEGQIVCTCRNEPIYTIVNDIIRYCPNG